MGLSPYKSISKTQRWDKSTNLGNLQVFRWIIKIRFINTPYSLRRVRDTTYEKSSNIDTAYTNTI